MEKKFVIKHIFESVLDGATAFFGETEEHFRIPWRLTAKWTPNLLHFIVGLECLSDCKSIEVIIESKCFGTFYHLFSRNDKSRNVECLDWFALNETPQKGTVSTEISVKIQKINGVDVNTLRCFDESNQKFSDVVLVVNGLKFYVSKLFLASHCTYFESLLMGNFKESGESEVELNNIDAAEFQSFLELINGESLLEDNMIDGTLNLADFFDSKTAIRRCEEYLVNKSKRTMGEKLRLALRFGLKSLMEKCVSEIKTIRDIRSVVPEVSKQVDDSIWKMLLEKSLEFH